jgi:hypothetical protein
MPAFHIETADDPLIFDASADWRGGMVNNVAPYLLGVNQYARAVDLDMDASGLLKTRRGSEEMEEFANPVRGMVWFSTPTHQQVLVAEGTTTHYYAPSVWNEGTGYSPDIDAEVCMVQGLSEVYAADGVNHIHYWDGVTWGDLYAEGTSVPADPSILEWHTQRLFAAGMASEPDTIHVSDILDARTFDPVTQSFRVGADGSPIVAMVPWDNFNLVVLKERSTWVVNCNPTASVANWTIDRVHGGIGCVARKSAVQVGNDVWWMSDSGPVTLRRLSIESGREISPVIGDQVQTTIDAINPSLVGTAAFTYYQNKVFAGIRLESTPTLVFYTRSGAWLSLWSIDPRHFAKPKFAGEEERLWWADGDGKVWALRDADVYTDGTAAIGPILESRGHICSEPINLKTGFQCEIEFAQSEALAEVAVSLDEGSWEVIGEDIETSREVARLPINLPFVLSSGQTKRAQQDLLSLGQWRSIQVRVRADEGKLGIRAITLAALLDTLDQEVTA